MSYNRPDRRMFNFGNFDFGGGADATRGITPPKGSGITLQDYGVFACIEIFNGGTLMPQMSVGLAADADAYGDEFVFGAVAVGAGKSVLSTYDKRLFDPPAGVQGGVGPADYILNKGVIPVDTIVLATFLAATGSGLTGQAIPFVVLDFDP